MTALMFTSADEVGAFLHGLASSPSDEADLTELEHLLQCADVLRKMCPDDQELQVAGLLHDVGWSLDPAGDHGGIGADAVRGLVGDRVADLIRLHVDAKRYLITRDAGYRALLSPVSIATLARQGEDMTGEEAAAFEASAHHLDAIRLRRADDLAKVPAKATSTLNAWLPVLRSVISRQGC